MIFTTMAQHRSCTGSQFDVGWSSRWPLATLVYLSLSGMAPAYQATDCQLVSHEGCRQLRSATSRTCVVGRTYSNYGDMCFAAAGPKLWNSLPTDLQQADIHFPWFKRPLKTFLFGCRDCGTLWLAVKAALRKFSHWLITGVAYSSYTCIVSWQSEDVYLLVSDTLW